MLRLWQSSRWLVLLALGACACSKGSEAAVVQTAELTFDNAVLLTEEGDEGGLVLVADANNDGWMDTLSWSDGVPYLNVALPDYGVSIPSKVAGLPSGPVRQALWLDLNEDRSADLLVLGTDGKLLKFQNESVDEYSAQSLDLPQVGPIGAFVVLDVNRDGRLDYVLLGEPLGGDAGTGAVSLHVYYGAVGNRFELSQSLTLPSRLEGSEQRTTWLQSTDLDGDGHWDVVFAAPGFGVGALLHAAGSSNTAADSGRSDLDGGAEDLIDGGREPVSGGEPFVVRPLFESDEVIGETSGVASVDYDSDGDVDLVRFAPGEATSVYVNDGEARLEVADVEGTTAARLGCVEDFDNDGRLDLLMVDKSLVLKTGTSKADSFKEALELDPNTLLPVSSLVCVDMDNDGDVDLVTAGRKGTGLHLNRLEPVMVEGANYFDFRFVGRDGNPAAIGTAVEVTLGKRTQRREYVLSGQAHMPGSPSAHFGLAGSNTLDAVRISWPDGQSTEVSKWSANDTTTSTQPE